MAIGHYALTRGTKKEDKKLLVALFLGELVFPYTLAFVQPTNNLLLDVEECKKQGKIIIEVPQQTQNSRIHTIFFSRSCIYTAKNFQNSHKPDF